eukprot:IDg17375t1
MGGVWRHASKSSLRATLIMSNPVTALHHALPTLLIANNAIAERCCCTVALCHFPHAVVTNIFVVALFCVLLSAVSANGRNQAATQSGKIAFGIQRQGEGLSVSIEQRCADKGLSLTDIAITGTVNPLLMIRTDL